MKYSSDYMSTGSKTKEKKDWWLSQSLSTTQAGKLQHMKMQSDPQHSPW
jgi:hypothetical protein